MLDFIVYWTTDRRIQERNQMERKQMHEIVAFTTAQRLTADEARSALPTSPIHPNRRRHSVRREVSVTLRRLADRLEPALASAGPVPAEYRDGPYRREATTT
ncbi:hypothetical protein [Phenylobacterium sp.]|jgi:predicted component of type VI protein secretion system|uniref:hypothetical protein n=1 Tax=Phenylobacterium sp. TaxID=1871053 RepID=UPI002E37562E|nr:hypothetical protein [Phenylobacterium sp.]HEX2562165.1 hypothetical protein [Phenylobacterium sp.]